MYICRVGECVQVLAPAKLNLFLEILSKRADRFHEIVTLITAVNLFDSLNLRATEDGEIRLDCRYASGANMRNSAALDEADIGELPREQDNLAWRALALLKQRSGTPLGASASLVKRIPAASGLGGGSSDAAAALAAGNIAWKLGWSNDALAELAAELGSDIPFFVAARRCGAPAAAICRGRGEQIETCRLPIDWHFVIARPREGL
ncbi:MAG: hypothetical protein KDA41_19370, partial [Planctomycetales bacterium]|nr:hypothetical protein [Planctomycetales bacterium]